MIAHAGGHLPKATLPLLVHEETLRQGAQVRIAQVQERGPQALEQLVDFLIGMRQEVGKIGFLGLGALDMAQDHLQGALKELHLPLDEKEIAGIEGAKQMFAGIPEPGTDRAGSVADLELEIEVAVAVGPELLVRDKEDILKRVAVGKLLHISPGHAYRPAQMRKGHQ